MKFYAGIILLFLMIAVSAAYGSDDEKKSITTLFKGKTVLWEKYTVKRDDHLFQLFRTHGRVTEKALFHFLEKFRELNPDIEDVDNLEPGESILIPWGESLQQDLLEAGKDSSGGPKPFGNGAFTSKGYVTRRYGDIEVLCDYYSVKKGDYIFNLFRTRGEIAERDLNDFLAIFKAINPSVKNADRVVPGQRILVPLKKIRPHTLPGQETGVVNLPHIRISEKGSTFAVSDADIEDKTSGDLKAKDPGAGEGKTEKSPLNERVSIRANSGGDLYFPRTGSSDYLLDLSKNPVLEFPGNEYYIMDREGRLSEDERSAVRFSWPSAKFLTDDNYTEDSFPVIDENGISLESGGDWLVTLPGAGDEAGENVCITAISDESQQTSPYIFNYLARRNIFIRDWLDTERKFVSFDAVTDAPVDCHHIRYEDKESFISSIAELMGYGYNENVKIAFSYAGFRVDALSNAIRAEGKEDLFVDFGELYGDAVPSILESGVKIITVKEEMEPFDALEMVLSALDVNFTRDPVFFAAQRPGKKTVSLSLKGMLISETGEGSILLTAVDPGNDILGFLREENVRVVIVEGMTDPRESGYSGS